MTELPSRLSGHTTVTTNYQYLFLLYLPLAFYVSLVVQEEEEGEQEKNLLEMNPTDDLWIAVRREGKKIFN